jgi:hypothetical protein
MLRGTPRKRLPLAAVPGVVDPPSAYFIPKQIATLQIVPGIFEQLVVGLIWEFVSEDDPVSFRVVITTAPLFAGAFSRALTRRLIRVRNFSLASSPHLPTNPASR